jgi:carbonic anhydrase/acetyltransferase-like protein (isoleucine patch superfamily)
MTIYEHKGVRPTMGEAVYVAPNATVIGDVHLGDESSVWFGAVLRGDCFPIRIGKRTNVQDGTVIHVTGGKAATTVGDEVTIGHMALLHGCTIGNRCLIGMGSIVLDDAEIGDESLVAAGSLVAPHAKFPPRSMIMGRPAKLLRTIRNGDLEWMLEAGKLYLGYSKTFLSSDVKVIG